ncbi:MAG: hypothetical protein ABW133_16130 [Polyangiaceae bacterium]
MAVRPPGPIEDHEFPDAIEARVMTPGAEPRLHGFNVEGDLAIHYRISELVQVALTGAAPDEARGRAFDIALQFLAPLAISEAPTHAAVLARLCGARTSSILAVTCIALAERARQLVADHRELFEWLARAEGDLPPRFRATCSDDLASVQRLEKALAAAGIIVPGLTHASRQSALFMTLHFAGLTRDQHFETVLVLASVAPTLAEAEAHRPGAFEQYPMRLPDFLYEEDR